MTKAVLPSEFSEYTHKLLGDSLWERYLNAFDEIPPVSIRLNPYKSPAAITQDDDGGNSPLRLIADDEPGCTPIPWCNNAYYLDKRPNFTLDPLLHAGAYYVQEASSMFLDEVLRQAMPTGGDTGGGMFLDLCAAPGGKSSLIRAAIPDDMMLFSNEPDKRRANILMENMQKQGHPNVIVTNNYPRDYKKAGLMFDAILTDVPCSGEGMFRKDEATIGEWSPQNVMKCQELQRSIVADIWDCLKTGGLLIYSTCTFNLREDEENVRWIMEELGADIVPIATKEEWNICGSLLKGWDAPVYRFIPGTTKGEGLFMAVLRKSSPTPSSKGSNSIEKARKFLRILSDGNPQPTIKGKSTIPAHAEAMLTTLPKDKYPTAELSLDDALHYLHHEAITLPPDVPRGFVIVTYKSLPLGFVKNIGNRANNLYPQEWRIRNMG